MAILQLQNVVLAVLTLLLILVLYSSFFDQEEYPAPVPSSLSYTGPDSTTHFNTSHDLKVRSSISFPFSQMVKSLDYILHTDWVDSVQTYVSQITEKQIIIVSATEGSLAKLLNWLSAVKLNTQISFVNILILAMDRSVHKSLYDRDILSILLDDNLFKPSVLFQTSASPVGIKRCTVARLLNHWGYDVIMFDLDAVILKDPRPLFESFNGSDIVGSRSRYPFDLYRKWGVTLCMGAVMFRSTSATETFWEATSVVTKFIQDDQIKFNNALHYLHIKWFTSTQCTDIKECTVSGITENNLNVTLLSQNLICRICDQHDINKYYIWQNYAHIPKLKGEAKKYNVWYLRDDWKDVWRTPPALGVRLIEILADNTYLL